MKNALAFLFFAVLSALSPTTGIVLALSYLAIEVFYS
jgi:hypothetical protein